MQKILIICLFFFAFAKLELSATTVIPFENIAAMGNNGDAVVLAKADKDFEVINNGVTRFRTQFTVLNNLKGSLEVGTSFALQSLRKKQGDLETIIAGDIEFEQGKTYLLFLVRKVEAPFWQPMMLSYGIHVEEISNGEAYLVPSKGTLEMHTAERPDGIQPEPPTVFSENALVQHLTDVFNNTSTWNLKTASSNLAPASFYPEDAAPSHCTYLNFGGNFRWNNFPDQAITLYSEDDGDNDFSPASAVHALIPDVVTSLETNYTGIDLDYQNTINFNVGDCSDGATSNNFQSFMGPLGNRNTLIQYNDPCNEIPNLSGCSGTLAFGGSYVGGSHIYDGQTWRTQLWGYVVFNEDVGTCNSANNYADYKTVLIHELTHSLGIGHISAGTGAANMNPSCCSNITDLDRECLNYTYPSVNNCGASPVSVNNNPIAAGTTASDGTLTSSGRVASGTSVAFEAATSIVLEPNFHAESGSTFSASIAACSNLLPNNESATYRFLDKTTENSPVIASKTSFKIQPNPLNLKTQIAINLVEDGPVSMAVYDLNGQLKKWVMQEERLAKGGHDINLDGSTFSEGMYYVVMSVNGVIQTEKMIIVR